MVLAEVEQLRRADVAGDPVLCSWRAVVGAASRRRVLEVTRECDNYVNGVTKLPVRVLLTPEVER